MWTATTIALTAESMADRHYDHVNGVLGVLEGNNERVVEYNFSCPADILSIHM